jgi:hypothetical protein
MRLVCKAWDAHLKPRFTNRYIVLSDLYYGVIPFDALSKAQRIVFDDWKTRKDEKFWLDHAELLKHAWTQTSTFDMQSWPHLSLFNEVGHMKVEIVEGEFTFKSLTQLAKYMPQVKVIQLAMIYKAHHPTALVEAYPKLQHLYISFHRSPSPSPLPSPLPSPSPPITIAPKLAKLVYYCNDFFSPDYLPFSGNNLVNLEILEIGAYVYFQSSSVDKLMLVLTMVGKTLRHLQIGNRGYTKTAIPPELWTLCPLLESLETRLCIRYAPPSPTENKLTCLKVPYPTQLPSTEVVIPIFSDLLRRLPALRQLKLFFCKKPVGDREQLKMRLKREPEVRNALADWVSVCKELNVEIVDWDGRDFDEAVLN